LTDVWVRFALALIVAGIWTGIFLGMVGGYLSVWLSTRRAKPKKIEAWLL